MTNYNKNINNIFYIFVLSHLIFWTLVPFLTNHNLPLDTIEALAWGSNLDWGFNKHPPMSALMVELFYKIFGNQDWAYYLLSQIFVILSFLFIWVFSKDFFKKKINIFLSILLLEGIYFYNYTTPEFNVYITQLPFWALTILFCWRGLKQNKTLDWLCFGIFAALGVLSHYLFLYLLFSLDILFFYLLLKRKINFKFCVSLVTFILVLLPHFIWLIENDFITLSYAFRRTGFEEANLLNHIYHPFIFLSKQLGILFPFFLMLSILILKFKIRINLKDKKFLFLFTVSILPVLLIFLTSMIMGVKIRTMWMTPFYLFIGVFFIYLFKEKIHFKKTNLFLSLFIIFFILSPFVYSFVSVSKDNKRTDYPGKEIAYLVQKKWDKNFSNEISIIVGDEWFGGNLSYHLRSRPKWFNKLKDTKNINIQGGVIYTGNPQVLKKICPGVYGTIRPIGICMIGTK